MNGAHSGLTSGNQSTFEQSEYSNKVSNNEDSVAFLVDDIANNKGNDFSNFPKKINKDKQGKHIEGHKNYQKGKSVLTISLKEAQRLIDNFSGKGKKVNDNKERVDFGKPIGKYVDPKTGKSQTTTVGIIVYSKTGTHIVPAKPKNHSGGNK